MKSEISFNCLFFRRFYRQLQIIFPKFFCLSTLLFFTILILVLVEQVTVYFIGITPSQYIVVLVDRDVPGFWLHSLKSLALVMAMAFILSAKKYSWNLFYIRSREMLTKCVQNNYFQDVNYYKLNMLHSDIDNVDQRITQDIEKICHVFGDIVPDLLVTPFNIAVYSYICYSYIGWIGPVSVYIFFFVSTIFNKVLMSPVVVQSAKQENLEGEFRYKHMHLRLNSESAAFYRCGQTEKAKVEQKLENLLTVQKKLTMTQFFLSLSVNMANYFGSILRFVVVGVPIFKGEYDHLDDKDLSAFISKSSFVTLFLIFNFTRLINMAPKVSLMAGCSHRVGQLMEKLDELKKECLDDDDDDDDDSPSVVVDNEKELSVSEDKQEKLAYDVVNADISVVHKNADSRLLVKNLSMQLMSGVSILVTGDSGVGKTSLIRALDNLWPLCRGLIERRVVHGKGGVFFLPQKAYFTNGSLREQLIFPDTDCKGGTKDEELIRYLEITGLQNLLHKTGGFDAPNNWRWEELFSPGEAQRIAFVRLFYHKPSFAVLDESTSQIGNQLERQLYEECIRMGITLLSIGHRASLKRYHDKELRILEGGGHEMKDLGGKWDAEGGDGMRTKRDDGILEENDDYMENCGGSGDGKVVRKTYKSHRNDGMLPASDCRRQRSISNVVFSDRQALNRNKEMELNNYKDVLETDLFNIYNNNFGVSDRFLLESGAFRKQFSATKINKSVASTAKSKDTAVTTKAAPVNTFTAQKATHNDKPEKTDDQIKTKF